MELYEVMRTTFACREFTGEPLPPEVLCRIVDSARFAPSGGNRQGWRIIHVGRDEDKEALADLSLPCATRYLLEMQAGESPFNTVHSSSVTEEQVVQAEPPLWLVDHIRHAPTLLVITVDLSLVAAMDRDLDRVGVIPGASIYPLAWNILLAARNEGFGGTLTTWGAAAEPEVQALLNIPSHWAVAALLPLGKPVKQLTRLRRKSVDEILVKGRWDGAPFNCGNDA